MSLNDLYPFSTAETVRRVRRVSVSHLDIIVERSAEDQQLFSGRSDPRNPPCWMLIWKSKLKLHFLYQNHLVTETLKHMFWAPGVLITDTF